MAALTSGRSRRIRVLDDGHDQSPLERHGDADVDVLVIDDGVAVDRCVDHRDGLQRARHGRDDERQVGRLAAGVSRSLLRILAMRGEVHLEHRVHVRRGPPAEHHVLGNLLPHHRHRLDAIAGLRLPCLPGLPCLPRLPCLFEVVEDVVLGHAARDAGPVDLRDIDVMFLRELPHQRRRPVARDVVHGHRRLRLRAVPEACGRRAAPAGAADDGRLISARARAATASGASITASTWLTADRLAFLRQNLHDDAGRRRGNLGVHLVGRDLQQRLVAVDLVADLLHPADDGALGDRFAHLGHHDIGGHVRALSLRMQRRAVRGVRRLRHGLGHGRMRVDRANQIFDGRLETQRQRRFGHQLRRARADHVEAEHVVATPCRRRS